jgi:hypothetical protein
MDRAAREALLADPSDETAPVGADDSLVRKIVDLFDGEVLEGGAARQGEGNA